MLLLQEFLNPWEMTLVQQINQAQAPVHIEVQERPTAAAGPDVTAELVSTQFACGRAHGLCCPKMVKTLGC